MVAIYDEPNTENEITTTIQSIAESKLDEKLKMELQQN